MYCNDICFSYGYIYTFIEVQCFGAVAATIFKLYARRVTDKKKNNNKSTEHAKKIITIKLYTLAKSKYCTKLR